MRFKFKRCIKIIIMLLFILINSHSITNAITNEVDRNCDQTFYNEGVRFTIISSRVDKDGLEIKCEIENKQETSVFLETKTFYVLDDSKQDFDALVRKSLIQKLNLLNLNRIQVLGNTSKEVKLRINEVKENGEYILKGDLKKGNDYSESAIGKVNVKFST